MEELVGKAAEVGGFGVARLLPQRTRRTVGAWCFVDHMGPGAVRPGHGLDVGPHPHIGLQTVTWLFEGAILHRDSLGSEQVIRPGQLNLMTAGHGVSHSEETTGVHAGRLHGIQLWVAQPASTRDGAAAFEHHADLPRVELAPAVATVFMGVALGASSPARQDTDHVGIELDLRAGRTVLPVDPGNEHAVFAIDRPVTIAGESLGAGAAGYVAPGAGELVIDTSERATVLVLGGVPFPETVTMWWNYVARSHAEITAAHHDWSQRTGRFGTVASPLAPIDVPGPPWN